MFGFPGFPPVLSHHFSVAAPRPLRSQARPTQASAAMAPVSAADAQPEVGPRRINGCNPLLLFALLGFPLVLSHLVPDRRPRPLHSWARPTQTPASRAPVAAAIALLQSKVGPLLWLPFRNPSYCLVCWVSPSFCLISFPIAAPDRCVRGRDRRRRRRRRQGRRSRRQSPSCSQR